MNRDDIIRMAREAGFSDITQLELNVEWTCVGLEIERFANLVEAAVLKRIKWNSIHSCHADCQNPACVIVREAVAAEREACAKVLDEMAAKDKLSNYYKVAALLIRERGAP